MNYDKPQTGIAGQSGRAGPKAPSDTTTGDVPSVTIGHGSVTTSKKHYSPRPAGLLEKTGRAAVAAGLPASVKIEPETVEETIRALVRRWLLCTEKILPWGLFGQCAQSVCSQ